MSKLKQDKYKQMWKSREPPQTDLGIIAGFKAESRLHRLLGIRHAGPEECLGAGGMHYFL